jgi:hypothetical protein
MCALSLPLQHLGGGIDAHHWPSKPKDLRQLLQTSYNPGWCHPNWRMVYSTKHKVGMQRALARATIAYINVQCSSGFSLDCMNGRYWGVQTVQSQELGGVADQWGFVSHLAHCLTLHQLWWPSSTTYLCLAHDPWIPQVQIWWVSPIQRQEKAATQVLARPQMT